LAKYYPRCDSHLLETVGYKLSMHQSIMPMNSDVTILVSYPIKPVSHYAASLKYTAAFVGR